MTAPTKARPHTMKIMTKRDGDRQIEWDKGKAQEVEDARASFDNHVKKQGYLAFAFDPATGLKGQQIRDFDPNLEKIILTPALRGG